MTPPEGCARVLVVDDEALIRKMIERALRDYDTCTAASVAEAKAMLQERAFDLVITDKLMPGEDGLSLVRWILEHHPDVSIIVMSGSGAEGLPEEIRFLSKSTADLKEIRNAVWEALAKESSG